MTLKTSIKGEESETTREVFVSRNNAHSEVILGRFPTPLQLLHYSRRRDAYFEFFINLSAVQQTLKSSPGWS